MKLIKLNNPKRVTTSDVESCAYDSITEFITAVKQGDKLEKSDAHSSKDVNWYGSSSFEEAVQIMLGFNNSVQKIVSGLRELKAVSSELTPQANKYSGRVNVASMLSGVENCRVRFREIEEPAKMVTMYIQMNALSAVSATNFVNKAIAVANAVNNLEEAGTRVELIGYAYSSLTETHSSLVTIKIKRFEDTLSLGQLYGAFAPSSFRRLIFRHIEIYWTIGNYCPDGYGHSKDWESPKGTINIPRSGEFNTIDRAVKFVTEKIAGI